MGYNILWKIEDIELKNINGFTNVVTEITWSLTATDETNISTTINGIFKLQQPNSTFFIEYEDLTEEIYHEWLLNFLRQDDPFGNNLYGESINDVKNRFEHDIIKFLTFEKEKTLGKK